MASVRLYRCGIQLFLPTYMYMNIAFVQLEQFRKAQTQKVLLLHTVLYSNGPIQYLVVKILCFLRLKECDEALS